MDFIGVDGCRAGWIAVRIAASGDWELELFRQEDPTRPWNRYGAPALILIDVPIGLLDGGLASRIGRRVRECDEAARNVLGPRVSSVFSPPSRSALRAETYAEGSALNRQELGVALSRQAWGIAPKIREVDSALRRSDMASRKRLRECHPEVCFWALNDGTPLRHPKRLPQGRQERLALLGRHYRRSREVLAAAERFKRRDVKPDDVLDALVAAVTAYLGYPDRLATLPEKPRPDRFGLPMEMVYLASA